MRTLQDIGEQYGTDKTRSARSLLRVYDGFLTHIRETDAAVLEIGVLNGASLRMWRDYFPNRQIYGIDIDPAAADHAGDRITVFIGPQADAALLDAVIAETGPLDLIVDDGSHLAADQIGSLTHLWPHLKPNGTYIVEDTHTSYMPPYGMAWRQPGTTIEFLKNVADDVHEMWHDKPVTLRACASICFFSETCVLRKRGH